MKKIKKPISILLSVLMVLSVFAVVPFTASAAVGDFVPESEYLTFTAEEAGSSVTLNYVSGTLKYNKNNSDWVDYTKGAQIDLENAGDSVRFRGKNTSFDDSHYVSIGGKVACSGNVMSLRLDDTGKVQGLSSSCFEYMFNGCTGLTAAPKLPETTLASYCYSCMFNGCESLTTAPELPATTLATRCYNYMFSDCKSLTTAPELPATTLATYCYYGMFYGCTSLTAAPALPATTLVTNCYASMFNGCTGIKLSETQTAEYSIPYRVPPVGTGTTTATNALNNMFANTGGTFKGKPTINTTYYRPAVKYTVTWKNDDGTILKTDTVEEGNAPTYDGTPVKAEDVNNTYTFSGWTDGTNTYGTTDTLPAVNDDVTYTAQFDAVPKIPVAYYIVGTMNGWTTSDAYKLTKNPANDAEYMFTDLTVSAKTELKVMDSNGVWYPNEAENFKLNDAGTYDIYFRPDGKGGDGWHHGNIFANNYRLPTYTVTWKNEDGTTLKTDTLEKDAVPAYTGTAPEKAEDERNTYTFSGWTDGTTTYGKDDALPAVKADVTYTATFTAEDKAVKNAIALINALPADVTVNDKDQIEAARAAYDALTDDQKTLITIETLDKLTAAETALALAKATADQAAADAVITQINALPADVTVNDKDQIEAARAAYDALTDDQKTLITTETLDKLTASETALAKEIDDKGAADAVIAQLNALPTDVTVDDKAQIEAARAAYDALTDDQKALITTETLDKLTVAETALAEAESGLNGPQDDGYFYLDDVKQIRYQLIQWHGDYYFINDGDKYAKNTKLYLSNTYVAGTGLAAGLYEFGADGKMQLKNGPQPDGYFYENGIRSNKLYRFVEFEGDWYFIYDAYKYAKNARLYLSGAFLEGTDFAPGYFDFDADGKYYIPEELPEGANADGYFYINGVKQTRYQLIKYGNDYYFINDDDKYAKNTKLYLSSTYVSGTDLPAGLYEFGADGKMIISAMKNGPQDDGYFYINGARCQKLYRFVEFDGDWYFINDGYKYAKNARLYLGNAFLEGTDFAPGYFVFGADGKLVTA